MRHHSSHSYQVGSPYSTKDRHSIQTGAAPSTTSYRRGLRVAAIIVPALCLALLLTGAWKLHVQASAVAAVPAGATFQTGENEEGEGGESGNRLFSDFEVEGEVRRKPSTTDGTGSWLVRSDRGIYYWSYADDQTEFKPSMPEIGQRVRVRGEWEWYIDRFWFVAERIEIKNGDNSGGDEKVEGILIAAPTIGTGNWIIQTGLTHTVSINIDSQTRLDGPPPTPGDWVEIRGQWQADETFTATRLRHDTHEVNEVVVRLAGGVISSTVATRYDLEATQTFLTSGNIHLFTTDDDEEESIMSQLAVDPDVIWAELNFTGGIPERHGYKTWRWGGEDPEGYVNQNAFHQVNLEPALTAVQGEGIVIAILDTGVSLEHSAFAGRLLEGYDMVDDDTNPNDDGDGLGWGHGTHIAGIVAQMSPQSKLLPVRVLDTNGRGNTFTLAYAIEWAVAHGADVVNLSLGAETDSQVLRDAINNATAAGVIVVAAAGNIHTDTVQFPAGYPGVLSVTAVDGENVKADFAAFGRGWVDLAAPGVGITSTIVGPYGVGYASWSGTSMATGFVSGAAALLRQQRPTASVDLIAQQLMEHARNVDAQNPAYSGKLGGLLNVAAALEMEPTQATVTPTPTPTPTLTPTQTPSAQPSPTATPTGVPGGPTPVIIPTPTPPITTSLPGDNEPIPKLFLPVIMR